MKTILFDLETLPLIAYTWGPKYEANLLEVLEHAKLACFAWKVLGEKKVHVVGPELTYKQRVKALWDMADEADVLIAHNAKAFDIKVMNAFFIAEGLEPPSHYRVIDTKTEARKYFRFPSNSLNDLGQMFGLGQKEETGGWSLWRACMEGDEKAWKKMLSYNKQDVVLLEQVYLKMRPYMVNHPNIGEGCICGSNNFHKRGWVYSNNGKTRRQEYRCRECRISKYGPSEKVIHSLKG